MLQQVERSKQTEADGKGQTGNYKEKLKKTDVQEKQKETQTKDERQSEKKTTDRRKKKTRKTSASLIMDAQTPCYTRLTQK